MPQLSKYELEREANIAKNKALLESLGLSGPTIERKEAPRKKTKAKAAPTASKKRKADSEDPSEGTTLAEEDGEQPPAKTAKTEDAPGGVRRSSRNAGKSIDYKKELKTEVRSLSYAKERTLKEGKLGSEAGAKRKHNPKQYGSIPGVEVGTWWETREGCSVDAIHAPWVGGISGGKDGAHSVALSGGYDDDVDLGYAFTYTGSGGRDLKGTANKPKNLRTAPQSSDQTFENNFNKMLKRSAETRKPVRVIRGYKLKSKYAPSEGYRYDGLYVVEKAWLEKGLNPKGYLVCKYAFKRLPNQPPLTVRALNGEGSGEASGDKEGSEGEEEEGEEENENEEEQKGEDGGDATEAEAVEA
ncbi:PUA-like domain-containing protein [Ephemerocybe angulata]|uniref:PUA-like domain-containing protein n=1 Tax=Ephemerocybe angulata TaxID=980116 RepID=A0A8H6MER5_9AGAR|nr:PUA-like domain-containing protein [Tulosesus angulatus]